MIADRTLALTCSRLSAERLSLIGNMKVRITILTATVILLNAYTDMVFSSEVPSNARSRKVIAKITPRMKKELEEDGLVYGSPIYIRVFKESSELELWVENDEKFKLFKNYNICSYSGTLGPKLRVGDLQSPEGFYFVKARQLNPSSQFHLSFNIGYPNAYDRVHGRTGSALMVHGDCVSIGCYAMTDAVIEEIYTLAEAAFRNGQRFFRVHIFPFRMTAENMEAHKESIWLDYWENLKEGYDFFERDKRPPDVEVGDKRYIFQKL